MAASSVLVAGRFPPPLDGQAVMTRTLADLLDVEHDGAAAVHRFDLSAPEGDTLGGLSAMQRLKHYLTASYRLRRLAPEASGGPVLWPAISPSPLGHLRDVTTVLPTLNRLGDVYPIVHRGDFHTLFERPLTRATALRLVRQVQGIVFLSPLLANRCEQWVPANKRFIIPNTISPDVIVSAKRAQEKSNRFLAGRPIRLLYLSGMIPSKGYLHVLETVAELKRRGVDSEATFAGRWQRGSDERDFWSHAESLDVASRIQHLGGVNDRGQVRDLHLQADLFLLPTSYPIEAQPLTIIEALNAATPVIATRHASISEMIEDGVSGQLSTSEPKALADAVEASVAPDVWSALSRNARSRYDEAFAPEIVRTKWMNLMALESN